MSLAVRRMPSPDSHPQGDSHEFPRHRTVQDPCRCRNHGGGTCRLRQFRMPGPVRHDGQRLQRQEVQRLRRQEVAVCVRRPRSMQLPLPALPDGALIRLHDTATAGLNGFRRATAKHGSLIQSWVRGARVVALDHYPAGGVVDRQRGSQFYSHCHRADGSEHGHIHLFWHATRSGRRRHLGRLQAGKTCGDWMRGAPSHRVSIGLHPRGLPVPLFTVNHGVTGGHWFDAPTTIKRVRRVELCEVADHADSCAWITAFVHLYEPLIARVLQARDRRLARMAPLATALDDRRVEVVSQVRLDWARHLQRLEEELSMRGLGPAGAAQA